MPSLRDIQRRIKSVRNTSQITKAMKMVSAAKLKRATDEITAARPYAEKMLELIGSLAAKTSSESHPLLSPGRGEKSLLVLMTSDRGLCGGFNTVLLRKAERFIATDGERHRRAEEAGDDGVRLYLIGKRGIEHFKRHGAEVMKTRLVGSARPDYATASGIAHELIGEYLSGDLGSVHVVYSRFRSALTQVPVVQQLLPVVAADEGPAEGAENREQTDEGPGISFIFEPSEGDVLSSLLPKYVEVQVFRAMLESSASEHGARMTAMDSASKNASEMISSLTLKYNRLRQAAITKELMEIIGGAEALKS